jgi:predicted transcriptional regulator
MKKMKKDNAYTIFRSWSDPNKVRPINAREEFRNNLLGLLIKDILADSEPVHKSKLMKVGAALDAIAHLIAAYEDQLESGRDNERSLRALREKFGRARRNVENSLKSLLLAENLLQDQRSELKRGRLKFDALLKDLKRLKKELADLESTFAAMIHPQLRKRTTEIDSAAKTPYKLHHLDLGITKGSADLKSLAVELVEKQLQNLTGGKSDHADRFISEFLRISLGWDVKPSYVKTLRKRIRDKKILESSTATEGNTPTSVW